ncbi:MAG: hypothetical protein WBG22_13385, partial [Rhodanobacter sp.]
DQHQPDGQAMPERRARMPESVDNPPRARPESRIERAQMSRPNFEREQPREVARPTFNREQPREIARPTFNREQPREIARPTFTREQPRPQPMQRQAPPPAPTPRYTPPPRNACGKPTPARITSAELTR